MKKLLFSLIALLAFASCSKTVVKPAEYYSDYQFKVTSLDLDNTTVSETTVWDFSNVSSRSTTSEQSKIKVATGDDKNDCHGDNGRTNPNCTVTPVKFVNVSFQRTGNQIYATWVAGVEVNVKSYYIQASVDSGKTWTIIKSLAPKGEGSKYSTSFSLWTKNTAK